MLKIIQKNVSFFLKRLIDFILALIGLIVLSPIFVLVLIALAFANQGKPFFFQQRPVKMVMLL
ncbi:hypothetical protein EJ377_05115 [Chryseobacterium arthrosphaerae]|uniref:Bacterial sugar transferase domain-containing protein n=1 Tax=Chryseobacterium arthrosphaerae TaxID=651561 RepID=A0A3S0N8H2_9FLAO|nr:hypothetical protein EJ377_05115 [Chryseobacterium arthrosphaerae]